MSLFWISLKPHPHTGVYSYPVITLMALVMGYYYIIQGPGCEYNYCSSVSSHFFFAVYEARGLMRKESAPLDAYVKVTMATDGCLYFTYHHYYC